MPDFKPQFEASSHEFDAPPTASLHKAAGTARTIESIRLGLTVVSFLSAITILGTSGDALHVYNSTHLGPDYFLALWPSDFDVRPTVALVACSSIIAVASIASLVVSKVSSVKNRSPLIHTSTTFLTPIICLFAAIIGTSFFYGIYASSTAHSLQTWTCQWSSISMDVKPHWGTLCKESKVALYLMITLIPIEVLILGTSAWGTLVENKQTRIPARKGSPAMS